MESTPHIDVGRVLIFKADLLYAEALQELTRRIFPAANVTVVQSISAASVLLATSPVDIFVGDSEASTEGDIFDLLTAPGHQDKRAPRVLVLCSHRDLRVLYSCRSLGVDGVFDPATEPAAHFGIALQRLADGQRYWSQSALTRLQSPSPTRHALGILTIAEQLVLSIIGGGCDDADAARQLGVSPSTLATFRRDLHRKLGAHHRGELIRLAVEHGFVKFTPAGVVRPGYAALAEAYRARSRSSAAMFRPDRSRSRETIPTTLQEIARPAA